MVLPTKTDLALADYFTDPALVGNNSSYYEAVRAKGPVWQEPHHGAFVVTGYEEVCEIYRDLATFSSINGVDGPFSGIAEVPHDPDDVSDLIEAFRDRVPNKENFITFEGTRHAAYRSLMMRMLTPKRMQENRVFIERAADEQLDKIAERGSCEFVEDYARPLSTLVIVDLLGVPGEEMGTLLGLMAGNGLPGPLGQPSKANHHGVLEASFTSYIEQRRQNPRNDILSQMAQAKFPDGSTPEPVDVGRVASQLFAGGHSTLTRFQTTALIRLADEPGLQQRLRQDPSLISNFVEEMLRLGSPAKVNFRMARVATTLAGVHIPAGSTLVLLLLAANGDPRRFDCPVEFQVDRSNAREHVAFGRGPHSCPGGPLTRTEANIVIERILDRLEDIRISEAHHGPSQNRDFDYIPSYILNGVESLHLEFTAR